MLNLIHPLMVGVEDWRYKDVALGTMLAHQHSTNLRSLIHGEVYVEASLDALRSCYLSGCRHCARLGFLAESPLELFDQLDNFL